MTNWVGRTGRLSGLWLAAVLATVGVGGVAPPASAEGDCTGAGRILAVEAEAGQLVEIPSCPDTSSFGSAVRVDAADWRGYSAIFAVRDGNATIVYAVTAGGELWWRRQEAAGATLGASARVGPSVNWNRPVVFASRPGYLHLGEPGAPIRTFRHQEWASGGAAVSEEANLFAPLRGPSITGLAASAGFAVGIWNGMNFRVWRSRQKFWFDEDIWYVSGHLPAGLASVVGDGYRLHAVNPAGEIVLLSQVSSGSICSRQDTRSWEVAARAPGHYLRVVVPVPDRPTGPPSVRPPPLSGNPACQGGVDGTPWEWQSHEP
jgi:hypothetical protein